MIVVIISSTSKQNFEVFRYYVANKNHFIAATFLATCKDDNTIYELGATYLKHDCSSQCTCIAGGIPVCQSLCLLNTTSCGIGEMSQNYEEPVVGTNCSCTKQRCLPGMLYNLTINFCAFFFRMQILVQIRSLHVTYLHVTNARKFLRKTFSLNRENVI